MAFLLVGAEGYRVSTAIHTSIQLTCIHTSIILFQAGRSKCPSHLVASKCSSHLAAVHLCETVHTTTLRNSEPNMFKSHRFDDRFWKHINNLKTFF